MTGATPETGHSGAHAHVRGPVPPPMEHRVNEIRGRMEQGSWRRASCRELAALWGLDESTVRRAAAEASRQLRPLGREEARARVEALLERAADLAEEKLDAATLCRVIALWTQVYGLRGEPGGAPGEGDKQTNSGARTVPFGFEESRDERRVDGVGE